MNHTFRNAASAYRSVGVESQVTGSSGPELVVLLYDGMLEKLRLARMAMQQGDVSAKVTHMGRALQILTEGLRDGLDLKAGGELARNLDGLYEYCSLRLAHANLHNDTAALDEVVGLLEPVAQAWRQQNQAALHAAPTQGVRVSAGGGGNGKQTNARLGAYASMAFAGA